MKSKTTVGLIVIGVISIMVLTGCLDQEESETSTPTPIATVKAPPSQTSLPTPTSTSSPLSTAASTPTLPPSPLLEIETPNWDMTDTEAVKIAQWPVYMTISPVRINAPLPFYKGAVPLNYVVYYEGEIPTFPPPNAIVIYDFYDLGFQNYFIYKNGYPVPDGALTLDKLGDKVAEARAMGYVTYRNESFLEIEEFHYRNSILVFYCKSYIKDGIKISEEKRIGKKEEEYYFLYPDKINPY
jgi:hypothetical protein